MSFTSSRNLPKYVRLPKAGEREHYSQLSLPTLDRLVRPQACNDFKPPVKSYIVRIRGGKDARKGARLIDLQSLLAYVRKAPVTRKELQHETIHP